MIARLILKSSALAVLIATGLLASAQSGQFTLKVGVDLVNVSLTVTDHNGQYIPGLNQSDFTVEEDGRKQDIQYFARENELPLTLAILVDESPSIEPVFKREKRTAIHFLTSNLQPSDLALVIGFDESVTLMQDFTEDSRLLSAAIRDLRIGPGTALYDAIYLAAREKLQHEAGRKAIILISDGEDTASKLQFSEALRAIHGSDAVVYSIFNRFKYDSCDDYFDGGDPGTLKKLSKDTGGAVFFLDENSDFDAIFAEIGRALRSQYSIGYRSANPAHDGKYRRIRIIPNDHRLRVRARKGYFAPQAAVRADQ